MADDPLGLRFGQFPQDEEWEVRAIRIHGAGGESVFQMDGVEVPAAWSELAGQILASKYLRAGETSARQVVGRIVQAICYAGRREGYFEGEQAEAFASDLIHLLLHQKAAFNSPVWFNVGLHETYGVRAGTTHFQWRGEPVPVDAYEHPQASACFIQSIKDNLVEQDGIFDLLRKEAQLFKYGSGTGTNFSPLRSRFESLSGGGTSSGLMSFLKVFDAAAGATKSGGTTRRAAKMVCLDADHPEILDFIDWKVNEERKAQALIAQGYASQWDQDAYASVTGQNANNSVRVTDAFMQAVAENGPWQTRLRDGSIHETLQAREVWDRIAQAAWSCADPGVQFHDTINKWHTCKATGEIRASNPCSEYMFLDDSACNLASLNLLAFCDDGFDVESFQHAVRVLIVAQDILVSHAGYPSAEIAKQSQRFRPLGLGYTNLGALCMANGLAYDSPDARALAAAVTSLMSGTAYATSASLAQSMGPFEGIHDTTNGTSNREHMARVMRMHLDAATGLISPGDWNRVANAGLQAWETACTAGTWRNAQATVIAPTGTISLLMDCDTTGIEPEFSLVKTKHMAGGGVARIINRGVPMALRRLGYNGREVQDIMDYVLGSGSLDVDDRALRARGFTDDDIHQARRFVASTGCFNDDTPGVSPRRMLAAGFSQDDVTDIIRRVEGHHHVEGSAIRPEHLPVFDCASGTGARSIAPMGHIEMMAAVQPFLSGAISKTVNVPHSATKGDVQDVFEKAWHLGLKAVALYRDGSKASQPLTARRTPLQDAPPCPVCGHETVRSGSCFRCDHCGTSIGCS